MSEIFSKKEFDELMKIKGEVRGMGMKGHAEFILKEEGEEGLKKLEETITNLGYPIKYKEMKLMAFYPVGLEAATLILIKRFFRYDDKKFQEMGKFGVKISFLVRLFTRYFVSVEKFAKLAPDMWKKGGALGDFKIVEYDIPKKRLVLAIENFSLHPLYCQVFTGYFSKGLQMIIGKETTCEETKCTHRGDDYHEFLLKW